MKVTPDQVQLISMALAHLAVERPGWYEMTRSLAGDLGDEGRNGSGLMFDRFHALHEAKAPRLVNDSIVQLRQVVERANPLLWAMVQEIAWPDS